MSYRILATGVDGTFTEGATMLKSDGSVDSEFNFMNGNPIPDVVRVRTTRSEYIGNGEIIITGAIDAIVGGEENTVSYIFVIDSDGNYARHCSELKAPVNTNRFSLSHDKMMMYIIADGSQFGPPALVAINTQTMAVEWSYNNSIMGNTSIFARYGDRIILKIGGGWVILNALTGSTITSNVTFPFAATPTDVFGYEDNLFFFTNGNEGYDIKCLDFNLNIIWQNSTAGIVSSATSDYNSGYDFAVGNNMVYFKFLDVANTRSGWRVGRVGLANGKLDSTFSYNVNYNSTGSDVVRKISLSPEGNIVIHKGLSQTITWMGSSVNTYSPALPGTNLGDIAVIPSRMPAQIFGARFIVKDSAGNIGFADKTVTLPSLG